MPRYHFAREPKATSVERIPEGFEIRESVNGMVSLARERPAKILPREIAAVNDAIGHHPKARDYRAEVRGKRIVVYELGGTDFDDVGPGPSQFFGEQMSPALAQRLRVLREQLAQYIPVMRFTLLDEETRVFGAERWCFLGSIDDWIGIGPDGPVEELARRLIPLLGTEALYEPRL
jgi:hypothetical protein